MEFVASWRYERTYAPSIDAFKNRLDKFWSTQEGQFDLWTFIVMFMTLIFRLHSLRQVSVCVCVFYFHVLWVYSDANLQQATANPRKIPAFCALTGNYFRPREKANTISQAVPLRKMLMLCHLIVDAHNGIRHYKSWAGYMFRKWLWS